MSNKEKPSKKYIKHGILEIDEKYDPYDKHFIYGALNPNPRKEDYLRFVEQRNKTFDNEQFYTNEEIEHLKSEIKPAECPICSEEITHKDIDNKNCKSCSNGHKFHYVCFEDQHEPSQKCPVCRSDDIRLCRNIYDTFSGGKIKHKKKNKTKRQNRTRRQNRTKRQNKKRKNKTKK